MTSYQKTSSRYLEPICSLAEARYDAIRDEWDLCHEFDPDECRFELDDIIFDSDGDNHPNYAPDKAPGPTDIFNMDNDMDEEDLWSPVRTTESIHEILLFRYGFNTSGQPAKSTQATTSSNWPKRIKALGEIEVPASNHHKFNIEHFLDSCLQKCPFAAEFAVPDRSGNTIERIQCNDQMWYVIHGKDPEPDGAEVGWDLAVTDPLTALECTRRPWTGTNALAEGLVMRGIPFSTRIRRQVHRIPARWDRLIDLGWRNQGWKARQEDYKSYAVLRDEFLRKPRGRAALLKGGIVWRLAIETLGSTAALSGPSQEVFTCGHQIILANGDAWWDDDLTSEELDLICGKYRISTGE